MRSSTRIRAVATMTILALSINASATDLHWDGGGTSDNWSDPQNWNPDQEPTRYDDAYINDDAEVDITHAGESCSNLYLGRVSGESGTIYLSNGSLKIDYNAFIGQRGSGYFVQTTGTNTVYGDVILAEEVIGTGHYRLEGISVALHVSGDITTGAGESRLIIADNATLQVDGGLIEVNYFSLGEGGVFASTYELEAGTDLQTVEESIGYAGTGILTQTGGSNTIDNELYLGRSTVAKAGHGTYTIQGGSLTAHTIHVGNTVGANRSIGELNWMGGTVGAKTINVNMESSITSWKNWRLRGALNIQGGSVSLGTHNLTVNHGVGAGASVSLSDGGELAAENEYIGYEPGMGSGKGTFTHTSGTNTIGDTLIIGYDFDDEGTYNISGGTLSAGTVHVGYDSRSTGTLNITDTDVDITVSNLLDFGPGSTFTAVPGSTIHMTGSDFENENKDPTDLGGLSNLTLIFEGGAGDTSLFEVAGAADGGFIDNYALGSLALGGADVGLLQLVDNRVNSAPIEESDCLFLHDLYIGAGSSLDVNGLLLYVEGDVEALLDGWIADGRMFDGTGMNLNAVYDMGEGWTCVVPEPTTLLLLALGGLALVKRKR